MKRSALAHTPLQIKLSKQLAFTRAVCSKVLLFKLHKADVSEYLQGIGDLEKAQDLKPSHPHRTNVRCEV